MENKSSMEAAPIEGPRLIETKTFADGRGYFRETYRQDELNRLLGRRVDFVQDNDSFSASVGVLRGLHFQRPPHAQAKLVKVVSGAIFDVIVDLRRSSATYGHWQGLRLEAGSGRQLFVPVGFAHGFCALTENVHVSYKVSDYYDPAGEGGLVWNDAALAIDWPLAGAPIISEKDSRLPSLAELGRVFE
ncbi:MAG: dTDP-4-dehydrorhamnose 3,5-epimerase [Candidatus Adiutrix sp.]|nr:dTDP-4-dehydrorhamnose 3,5-epimerase [Candidatus Adiutrix sp.]